MRSHRQQGELPVDSRVLRDGGQAKASKTIVYTGRGVPREEVLKSAPSQDTAPPRPSDLASLASKVADAGMRVGAQAATTALHLTPEAQAAVDSARQEGYQLLPANATAPSTDKLVSWQQAGRGENAAIRYVTVGGGKYLVLMQVSPALYVRVLNQTEARARLDQAKRDGYLPTRPDETFDDPLRIDAPDSRHGLIRFETEQEGPRVVARERNPGLYDKLAKAYGERTGRQVDQLREANGLPASDATNVLRMASDVNAGPDAAPGAGKLRVGELATRNLLDSYRDRLQKGDIGADAPAARLCRLMEAKGALQHGSTLIATGFLHTYELTPRDMKDLLDPSRVDTALVELFQDPSIQRDYAAQLGEAIKHLPDRARLAGQLHDMLNSPGYARTLEGLQAKGLGERAQQMVRDDLMSLGMLNPQRAAETAQRLAVGSLEANLRTLVGDPAKLERADIRQATSDALEVMLKSLRTGTGVANTYVNLDQFINEFIQDKQNVNALGDVIRQALLNRQAGKPPAEGLDLLGEGLTETELNRLMDQAYLPMEQRSGVSKFIAEAKHRGVWSSIAGGAAMASFAYRLSKGAWGKDASALDRWAAARDLISFLGQTSNFAKTAESGAALLMKTFFDSGKTAAGALTSLGLTGDMLDLGDVLPRLFDESRVADAPDLADAFHRLFAEHDAAAADLARLSSVDDAMRQSSEAIGALYSKAAERSGGKVSLETAGRVGRNAMKVLGVVSDLAGIADIVTGALGLDKAIKDGNVGAIVANSISITSGTLGAVAGGIAVAELFLGTAVPTALSAAVVPLGVAGAVLGIAGLLILPFLGRKLSKAEKAAIRSFEEAERQQDDWFKRLDRDGVVREEWQDKLGYARQVFAMYLGRDVNQGGRPASIDYPADNSIWRAQPEEWLHYRQQHMASLEHHRYFKEDLPWTHQSIGPPIPGN